MKDGDLHIIFNDDSDLLKVYDHNGFELFRCEAQNNAVRGPSFFHWGRCPRGQFVLGKPSKVKKPAFGFWFVPVYDYGKNQQMAKFARRGIGIHGGGTGLANPFAPKQGWKRTHGCIRVQNIDLEQLVSLTRIAQDAGGKAFLTVAGD